MGADNCNLITKKVKQITIILERRIQKIVSIIFSRGSMAKVQPSDARGVRRRNGEGGKFNVSTIWFSFDLNSMNFFGMPFMYLVR